VTSIEVLVIGAGVSGLTTAILLAESGLRVAVRTRELPRDTHSSAAGAIWGPFLATHQHLSKWSLETLAALRILAGDPDTGVKLLDGVEAARGTEPVSEPEAPEWITQLDGTPCPPGQLPKGFAYGWRFTAPVADMPAYLDHLTRRLAKAGGELTLGTVTSLADAVREAPVVVNCTGLGARELAGDDEVVPVRGQLVIVENPGIDRFFGEHAGDSGEPTYFLPHGDHVVLGSTAERGRADLGHDHRAAGAIVDRCAAVEPALRHARVLSHRVGIRPSRSSVRVEHVPVHGRSVIHNYGHGGSGVSLSWGCAREVVRMVHAVS